MSNEEALELKVYRNRPQMIANMVNPHILILEWGRRTGKSEGVISYRALRCAMQMPRSAGFFAGKSYRKILDHLLPGIISGWEKLGLREDIDFVVCKKPTWLDRPITAPRTYDHFITFRNGSGIHLISFDHRSTSNGLTTDWGVVDEAKQLDPERVNSELLKTMNGHQFMQNFEGVPWRELPEHRSLTLSSDKFIGKRDFRWLDKYKKQSSDPKLIQEIIAFQIALQEATDEEEKKVLQKHLWQLQSKCTLYLEASSEENLAVLGIDYFEDAYKTAHNMLELRVSIFNEDVKEIENGFYTLLDESVHTYEANNYSRLDAVGVSSYLKGTGKDCRMDSDWKTNLPLIVNVDYGSIFSWAVVKQNYMKTNWTLKNFWSEAPKKFTDMAEEICKYYQPHEHRVIHLYDDPAGHKENTRSHESDLHLLISIFRKNGWTVVHRNSDNRYIPHRLKYRIANAILDEKPTRMEELPKARININNAFHTFTSMAKAPIKLNGDGYQKDKSSEKNTAIDQRIATHLSDAWDMDICYQFESAFEGRQKFSF